MPHSPPTHRYRIHQSEKQQRDKDYNKTRSNQGFYNSTRWKKVRSWFKKQSPLCVMCKAEGLTTPVQIVDHIIELKDGGAPFDQKNLQSLCHRHHNQKTAQKRLEREGG